MNVELVTVQEDLAYERAAFERASRAPFDGRMGDPETLAARQEVRRRRIVELEARRDALVALEESAAELREQFDSAFSSFGGAS